MKLNRADFFSGLLIFIISVFFVLDLFLVNAQYATFDAPFHITNMAQFYLALRSGDFPVVWEGGIANYGLPIGLVAHQLTSYLGAFLIFLTRSPLLAFNLVAFMGIFFSSLSFFVFSRIYFRTIYSFSAAVLYTFTSYKITNFYIRGAIPEMFAAIFLPLILVGFYAFLVKKKFYGLVLTSISFFLLTLNHPMMLLIYSTIYLPYLIYLLVAQPNPSRGSVTYILKSLITIGAFVILGMGMASYYLIPLNLEIKYFYYGLIKNHLTPDNFRGLTSLARFNWSYFTISEIFPRGHIIFAGPVEILSLPIGLLLIASKWFKNKKISIGFLEFCTFTALLIVVLISPISSIFYEKINVLSNIQFPWRMLSALIFFPPLIFATVLERINKAFLALLFILLISLFQFPQLYGKNYMKLPGSIYYSSAYNPHSVLMNSIWSGKTEEYPIKTKKADIISGNGQITSPITKNSSRSYQVDAKNELTMIDYTFYFPGWNVYVDKNPVNIEFQNPIYRGVITYKVPSGNHSVLLKFEDTKIRLAAKILSLIALSVFVLILVFRKRLNYYLIEK